VLTHRIVAAHRHQVPAPFRALAVRSEEPAHAGDARAPYERMHVVRTDFLDTAALAGLVSEGYGRIPVAGFLDTEHARTSLAELATTAPTVPGLPGAIAAALQLTGVLGGDTAPYRRSLATRIDYLSCRGAGFHNDVARHWPQCLFWVLALDAADVEFVMPHAGVRLTIAPGDLLVFDPTMAHGLCRPADGGQALATSFETGASCRQLFLTGELRLDDAQWAALGSPWLPVQEHERRGALDLMVASFDDRSGAIQRLHALRDGMKAHFTRCR